MFTRLSSCVLWDHRRQTKKGVIRLNVKGRAIRGSRDPFGRSRIPGVYQATGHLMPAETPGICKWHQAIRRKVVYLLTRGHIGGTGHAPGSALDHVLSSNPTITMGGDGGAHLTVGWLVGAGTGFEFPRDEGALFPSSQARPRSLPDSFPS